MMCTWNNGYYIEGLDRCNTILTLIEELLVDHPSTEKVPGIASKIEQASDLIMSVYQDIGKHVDKALAIEE